MNGLRRCVFHFTNSLRIIMRDADAMDHNDNI